MDGDLGLFGERSLLRARGVAVRGRMMQARRRTREKMVNEAMVAGCIFVLLYSERKRKKGKYMLLCCLELEVGEYEV